MSLRVVADARVWTALVDLLTVGNDEPYLEFSTDRGVWAKQMGFLERVMYETRYPAERFEEFVCPEPVYAKIYRDNARSILRRAKGRVELTAKEEKILLAGHLVGEMVPRVGFEVKIPPEIKLRFVNKCVGDAYRFRRWLSLADRAMPEGKYVGFSGRERLGGIRVVAFDDYWRTWLEYPFESTEAVEPSTSVYPLDLLLSCLPPSAVTAEAPRTIRAYTPGKDDHPLYAETENLYPEGVEYRFWVAPVVDQAGELRGRLDKEPPIESKAVVSYERAELFFDMLQSNTDEPEILFDLDGLKTRNMDTSLVTMLESRATPEFFRDYHSPKPIYAKLSRDRRQVSALVDIAKLLEEDVRLTVGDGKLWMWRCVVGEVKPEEEQRFEAVEARIDLRNWMEVDNSGFYGLLREWTSERARRKLEQASHVSIAYDRSWNLPKLIFTSRWEILGDTDLKPVRMAMEEDRILSTYDTGLVMLFLPPSAARVSTLLTLRFETLKPLAVEFTPWIGLEYRAYIAPDPETWRMVAKEELGWLKPLAEEDVLAIIRARAPELVGGTELRNILAGRMYDVENLDKILGKLVDEGKLAREKRGYANYYRLAEQPPRLKPLTEDIVLETIRILCESLDTDAVGFLEIEAVLGKEYDVKNLRDILKSLEGRGLVESKPWPDRMGVRRMVAADMRGYWSLKRKPPRFKVGDRVRWKKKPEETYTVKEMAWREGRWIYLIDGATIPEDELEPVAPTPLSRFVEELRSRLTEVARRFDDHVAGFHRVEERFRELEEKPEPAEIESLIRGVEGMATQARGIRGDLDRLRSEASDLLSKAVGVEPEEERLRLMRELDAVVKEIDTKASDLDFILGRYDYFKSRLTELREKAKPPVFKPEAYERELREYAVGVAVKTGLARGDAERLVEELWEDIMSAARTARSLEEAREFVSRMVEPEARRRVAAPPPRPPVVAPPPPPAVPVEKTPEALASWIAALPSGEMSYMLTFGVEQYVTTYGGRYTFTVYDAPLLASALAGLASERGRSYTPSRATDYYAAYFLQQMAPYIPYEGVYKGVRRIWDVALASAREYFRVRGLPSFDEITVMVWDPRTGRWDSVGFGRVWMDAVAYEMYRIMGVEDADIPEDLRRAARILEEWRRQGMPRILYVKE